MTVTQHTLTHAHTDTDTQTHTHTHTPHIPGPEPVISDWYGHCGNLIMHHSNNAFYKLISFLVVAIYIYIKPDTLLSMP